MKKMAEIINQCCYTHMGSWTAVAQKGDFEQKYIGELSRHSTLPGAEYGENLSVFETVGCGDKFLIMRTQYGLRDLSTESGRASMFSHGYLININGELFDPNEFLTINDDNFCADVESANVDKKGFQRDVKYTLKDALKVARLTKESFSKLLKCVYQLSVRSINKQALMIKSNNINQIKAILYCIYAGLLPRYSRNLSSASAPYNFSDMRNVVFVSEINSSKKYFIPESGENNVLSPNVDKNLDRLYFIDYGVKYFSDAETIQEYFVELEKTIAIITDRKQVDDEVIKIAHIMTADPQPSADSDIVSDDDALKDIMGCIEESEVKDNAAVRQYYEKLRAEAIRRGLIVIESPAIPKSQDDDGGFEDISDAVRVESPKDIPFNRNYVKQDNPKVVHRSIARTEPTEQPYRSSEVGFQTANTNPYRTQKFGFSGETPFGQAEQQERKKQRELQNIKSNLDKYTKAGSTNLRFLEDYVNRTVLHNPTLSDAEFKKECAYLLFDAIFDMMSITQKQINKAFEENPILLLEEWGEKLSLSRTEITQLVSQILVKYWDGFDWRYFTLTQSADYYDFRLTDNLEYNLFDELKIKRVKRLSALAIELIQLASVGPESVSLGKWLIDLNIVCNSYRDVHYDKQSVYRSINTFFVNLVARVIYPSPIKNEVIKKNSVAMAFALYEEEYRECLDVWIGIYNLMTPNAVSKQDYSDYEDGLISKLEEFARRSYEWNPRIKNALVKDTIDLFAYFDKIGRTIPLDYWIALGCSDLESPFRIFYSEQYDYQPAVMNLPVAEIVNTSKLLREDYYRNCLLVTERKSKSGFIKKLIKEIEDDGGESKGMLRSLFKGKK